MLIKMPQEWRRRRGRRGRHPKPVQLGKTPNMKQFIHYPLSKGDPIHIDPAELEALRLVDLEGLSQEEAGERMSISRGTIWRILQSARKKVTQALIEVRPLILTSE